MLRSIFHPSRRNALVAFAATAVLAAPACAVEAGISPYLKGFAGFMSGYVPPAPVNVVNNIYYHFDGEVGASVRNGFTEFGLEMTMDAYLLQGVFVTDITILGGNYAFGLAVPYAWANLDAAVTGPLGNTFDLSISNDDVSDSLVTPIVIGWHAGAFHWNAGLSILAPTGAYEKGRLNVGRNTWGLLPAVALTWFDPELGWDLSGSLTYLTLANNEATDYQSGDILHFDWAIGKRIGEWEIGVAGNIVQQITGDSGGGAKLGDFEVRSIGIGPALTYSTKIGEMPFSFSAKWEHDISSANTFSGDVVTATATLVF